MVTSHCDTRSGTVEVADRIVAICTNAVTIYTGLYRQSQIIFEGPAAISVCSRRRAVLRFWGHSL